MRTIIGLDFSLNKPACCVLSNNIYYFISWPLMLQDNLLTTYERSGVNIINRENKREKSDNLSDRLRNEISDSMELSKLITDTLKQYFIEHAVISIEGPSFSSAGNISYQISGYRYILMRELLNFVSLDHIYTYAPITIKSIAMASKRDQGKSEMIDSFIKMAPNCRLFESLNSDPNRFKKRGGNSWVTLLDDLIDSFWCIETLRYKEPNLFS